MYKAGVSNSSCQPCPNNSLSIGEGNAVCQCIPPNIRNPDRPQDPCASKSSFAWIDNNTEGMLLLGSQQAQANHNPTSCKHCPFTSNYIASLTTDT